MNANAWYGRALMAEALGVAQLCVNCFVGSLISSIMGWHWFGLCTVCMSWCCIVVCTCTARVGGFATGPWARHAWWDVGRRKLPAKSDG